MARCGVVDLLLLPRSASAACREKAEVPSLKSMRESPSPSWTFSCSFYVNAIVSIGYWFFSSSNIPSFPGFADEPGTPKGRVHLSAFFCVLFFISAQRGTSCSARQKKPSGVSSGVRLGIPPGNVILRLRIEI